MSQITPTKSRLERAGRAKRTNHPRRLNRSQTGSRTNYESHHRGSSSGGQNQETDVLSHVVNTTQPTTQTNRSMPARGTIEQTNQTAPRTISPPIGQPINQRCQRLDHQIPSSQSTGHHVHWTISQSIIDQIRNDMYQGVMLPPGSPITYVRFNLRFNPRSLFRPNHNCRQVSDHTRS